MAINIVGATATGVTSVIVLVAKFTEGAWVTLISDSRAHLHDAVDSTALRVCPQRDAKDHRLRET